MKDNVIKLTPRPTKQPKKKRGWFFRFFKYSFYFLTTIVLLAVSGLIGLIVWIAKDTPDINNINTLYRHPYIIVKDQKGDVLATYGDVFSKPISIKELPEHVPQAFISVEDKRFYHHFGLDFLALLRAFQANRKAGRIVQGGSSITQQLAKNLLITSNSYAHNDQSYKRKLQEVYIVFQLERKFSKDQILALYLNRAYLGARCYGIDAAAQQYFAKSASELNVFEAAMIAGLLKAPSKYSPMSNVDRALIRAKVVLKLMEENGYIKNADEYYEQGKKYMESIQRPDKGFRYFTDWVNELVPLHLEEMEDVEVTTTIDREMQETAEKACRKVLKEEGEKYKVKEVAMVVMTPQGEIKAMVGGKGYDFSQYNRVTQALRQPGSSIKPLIYMAAMEKLGLSKNDQIDDTPFKKGSWEPSNFHWKHPRGTISLYDALRFSVNSVTIRLAEMTGLHYIHETLQNLGIATPMPDNLTIALGTGEVTLLDLTGAYSSFSNGGYLTNPHGILAIQNKQGKYLYKRKPYVTERVMSVRVYDDMRDMLNAVIATGTGRRTALGHSVYGKTGSNADRDAYTISFREDTPNEKQQGYTNVVVGVWVGNDLNEDMHKRSLGGTLPAMITKLFYTKAV